MLYQWIAIAIGALMGIVFCLCQYCWEKKRKFKYFGHFEYLCLLTGSSVIAYIVVYNLLFNAFGLIH